MNTPAELWSSFTHDPRLPENSALRAADVDRAAIHHVLTEAYADGRLDREEFDVRASGLVEARTLGELPGLVRDLVPTSNVPALGRHGALASPVDLDHEALERWKARRREALRGLLGISVLMWSIWAITSGTDSFPWPAFVSLAALMNLLRVATSRTEMVAENRRRLEKKQRRALEEQPPEEQS